MATHALSGAAAAAATSRVDTKLNQQHQRRTPAQAAFEAAVESELLHNSLKRFARAGTVPPADTKDTLDVTLREVTAKLQRRGDENENQFGESDPDADNDHQHRSRSAASAAAPVELDPDALNAAQQERLHSVFLLSLPRRLRTFLHPTSSPRNLDIFRDVVVRLPIVGAGRDEVLPFCRQFGECEYCGPCARSNNGETKHQHREFCHIVSFARGADAIKCFVELNGFFIDPNACQATLESIVAAAVKRTGNEKSEEAKRAAASVVEKIPKALVDLHVKSGECFSAEKEEDKDLLCCWSSRLIFVTCDFFRAAFYKKKALCNDNITATFIPRAEMLTRSCFEEEDDCDSRSGGGSSNSLFSSFIFSRGDSTQRKSSTKKGSDVPASWNPADVVCRQLAQRARELIRVYPLVASHKEIEWVGMCRASNTISMFIPIPSTPAPQPQRGSPSSDEKQQPQPEVIRNQHLVWFITLRALRQCRINVVALFRAIDSAKCVDDLVEGSKLFALRSTPLQPPQPATAAADKDENNNDDDDEKTMKKRRGIGAFPSLKQMFGGFFSPDPGQRGTNRIFEIGAFVLLAIVVVWVLFTAHVMMNHPKPRFGRPQDLVNMDL